MNLETSAVSKLFSFSGQVVFFVPIKRRRLTSRWKSYSGEVLTNVSLNVAICHQLIHFPTIQHISIPKQGTKAMTFSSNKISQVQFCGLRP